MNNSMMSGTNSTTKERIQSLEEFRAQIANIDNTASLSSSELKSLDDSQVELNSNKELQEEKAKVKIKIKVGANSQGFVDALVLGFLTGVAGLMSVLYMLFNITSALY